MTQATRAGLYDPALPDDVNFGCIHCGAQTVTGYDGPGDRSRVSHVYDKDDSRYLRSGTSTCHPLRPATRPQFGIGSI